MVLGTITVPSYAKDEVNNRIRKIKTKLHIRYYKHPIDYVAIFVEKPRYYILISNFPVFYINKKKTFYNDYIKYKKT